MVKFKTIYKNGEYNVICNCIILKNKYGKQSLKYKLDDYAENLFGKDFLGSFPKAWDFNKTPAVVAFLARMSANGKMSFEDETIVYGKIYDNHAGFGTGELMLLSEIEFPYSIKEVNELVKKNKIKIK